MDQMCILAKISEVATHSQNVFASFAGGIIGEDSPYSKMKSYKGLDGAFASFRFRFLIPVVIAGSFKAYEMYISYKEEKLKILKQQKSYEVIENIVTKLEKDVKEDRVTRSIDQM